MSHIQIISWVIDQKLYSQFLYSPIVPGTSNGLAAEEYSNHDVICIYTQHCIGLKLCSQIMH